MMLWTKTILTSTRTILSKNNFNGRYDLLSSRWWYRRCIEVSRTSVLEIFYKLLKWQEKYIKRTYMDMDPTVHHFFKILVAQKYRGKKGLIHVVNLRSKDMKQILLGSSWTILSTDFIQHILHFLNLRIYVFNRKNWTLDPAM